MNKVHLFTMASLTTLMLLGVAQPAIAQEQSQSSLPESTTPTVAVGQINQAIEALATELMTSLPPTGTYVVKNANDTSSGVPEDLLAQMTSSLQTSLMVASNFSLTLIDQAQLQESWANAVEFNGADFETMVAQANFDALIVLNTRATPAGLEVSLQAVGATSSDAGKILASTKLRSVDINWSELKSVDYSEKMSDKVLEIQKQLEALKFVNEPVLEPLTFSDHYHNAMIYRKRNDNHKEISSLESALQIEPKFFDVLSDLVQALTKVYGTKGAADFVDVRLSKFLPSEMIEYAMLILENSRSQEFPAILLATLTASTTNEASTFAPLAAQWIKASESTFIQSLRKRQENLDQYPEGEPGAAKDLYNFLSAVRIVIRSYDSGEFQAHFLDVNRSYALAEIEKMRDYEREFNQVEYGRFSTVFDKELGLTYHYTKWKYDEQGRPISGELVKVSDPNTLNISKIELDDVSAHCNFKAAGAVPRLELDDPRVLVTSPLRFVDPADPSFQDGNFWYQFPGLPIDVSTDRIVFGDACRDAMEAFSSEKGVLRGIHRLLITDDVDISKSIILEFTPEDWETGIPTYKVDISTDGTYFLEGGAPISSTSIEGFDVFPSENNGWLFAPGIVQSALFAGGLVSVSYTDVFGVEKTIVDGRRSNIPNIRNINAFDDMGNHVNGSLIGGNYGILNSTSFTRVDGSAASDTAIAESEGVENSNGSTVGDDAIADSEDSLIQWRIMTDTETVVTSFRSLTFDDRTAVQEILASKGLYNGAIDGKWGEGTRLAFEILFTVLQSNGVKYYVNTPDNFVSMMIMVKGLDASYFSSAISTREASFGKLCAGDILMDNCFAIRLPSAQQTGIVAWIGFWDNNELNGPGVAIHTNKAWSGHYLNFQLHGEGKFSLLNEDGSHEVVEGKFSNGYLVEAYETPVALDIAGDSYMPEIEFANTELPSFDCNQQLSIAESTICTYRGLSQAEQTSTNYFNVLKQKKGPEIANLVADYFLERRDACGSDPDCMEQVLGHSTAVFHDLSL